MLKNSKLMVTDMSGHKMIFAHIGRFLNLMSYTCYFNIDKNKKMFNGLVLRKRNLFSFVVYS